METSDFGLIVTLKTLGFNIDKVTNDTYDRNKKIAHFKESKELKEAIDKYWDNDSIVDALTFANNIRNVKTELQERSKF